MSVKRSPTGALVITDGTNDSAIFTHASGKGLGIIIDGQLVYICEADMVELLNYYLEGMSA